MSRALGPRVGIGHDMAAPAAVVALLAVPVALAAWAWTAGCTASWLTGHGFTGPALSTEFATGFVTTGPAGPWPGVPALAVWTLFAAGVAAALAVVVGVWWKVTAGPAGADPLRSLATETALAALAPAGAAARARQLRPSLAGERRIPPGDVGVALGRLLPKGPVLRTSWEDVLLAVMAPRAGKTTALAIPAILDAPGAVIATSNKADLWAATAALRAEATGETVWTFDPQRIAHAPQTWWWNPLSEVDGVD